MPHHRIFILAVLSFAVISPAATETSANRLCYAQPAGKWTDALPVGDGYMGAMVFGGIANERIQFNEDTLWRG